MVGFACAQDFFEDRGMPFTELDVSTDVLHLGSMLSRAKGARTVPQIFIDGKHVGGCADMLKAAEAGKLPIP